MLFLPRLRCRTDPAPAGPFPDLPACRTRSKPSLPERLLVARFGLAPSARDRVLPVRANRCARSGIRKSAYAPCPPVPGSTLHHMIRRTHPASFSLRPPGYFLQVPWPDHTVAFSSVPEPGAESCRQHRYFFDARPSPLRGSCPLLPTSVVRSLPSGRIRPLPSGKLATTALPVRAAPVSGSFPPASQLALHPCGFVSDAIRLRTPILGSHPSPRPVLCSALTRSLNE